MREKIEKICEEFVKESQGKLNIPENLRMDLKNMFKNESDIEIICDEKNNSHEIVKRNCIISTFLYNENDECKKLNIIIGSKEDVNELKNMNLCFDTTITWKVNVLA